MKRRLAWLLALSLTFASLPVTGAGAAENTVAGTTEIVTQEVQGEQEETTEGESAVETVIVETNDGNKEESKGQNAVEGQEIVSGQEENSENVVTESVTEGTTEAVTEGTTEAVTEGTTEAVTEGTTEAATEGTTEAATEGTTEAATEGTTVNIETAAVIEPTETTVAEEATQNTVNKFGWVLENGKWYFYNASGKYLTGWQYISDKWYYLGSDGARRTGWQDIGANRYYFNGKGIMLTGWQYISGYWYYFEANGAGLSSLQTGWKKINNKWYYFESDGKRVTLWKDINGKRYFFNGSGVMLTNWQLISGKWYYFSAGGAMQKGWAKINSKWYYLGFDGVMKTSWQNVNGKWYYLGFNGDMKTGWQNINNSWYYFNSDGVKQIGWLLLGKKYYYLGTNGKMVTGLQKVGIRHYYFTSNGVMQTGWVKQPSGRWSYYQAGGAALSEGWKAKDSDWFYLGEDGVAKAGWLQWKNGWYYLDAAQSGRMVTAPTVIGVNLYFFDVYGKLASTAGWKNYNGKMYYTNAKGVCYRNTTIDGVKIGADGVAEDAMNLKAQTYSSNTNYLILVDKTTYKVGVYKKNNGTWVKIKDWYCTHGGSNTPNGEWVVDDHVTKHSAAYGWADFDYSSAAFAVHISAGNYFHSVLYEKYTRGNPYDQWIMDPDLKQNYSHGCIRLETENAEWIWDNIPFGTKVVVYNS